MKIRCLGFDPGIAITGYGVIDRIDNKPVWVDHGVIRTPEKMPHHERLLLLAKDVRQLLIKYQPTIVGVETLIFARNTTTALPVGEARGVLMLLIAETGLPLIELTPLQVKQALTTYGRADKQQMQYMVKQVLSLQETPQPDDAADALAVALAAEQVYHSQKLFSGA